MHFLHAGGSKTYKTYKDTKTVFFFETRIRYLFSLNSEPPASILIRYEAKVWDVQLMM